MPQYKGSNKNTLKSRGMSKKGSGQPEGKSYQADDKTEKRPRLLDRGPGSSFNLARFREEATRARASKKVPGNLGFQEKLGKDFSDMASSMGNEKKKLLKTRGKKSR